VEVIKVKAVLGPRIGLVVYAVHAIGPLRC
jgi:hypothetical protein